MMIAILALGSVALAGCAAQEPDVPTRIAPKTPISAARTLTMEQMCKDEAAQRYNTEAQQIQVQGVEAFQGSYEMPGRTGREEGFTCTFDPEGQFLHLSMR
ncbi:hypothetical protein GWD52_02210 [Enterobacteriaceae bacterium 4M9]|nr:hypothetical protein [Enterobacteriaceae bacterium 4M9]